MGLALVLRRVERWVGVREVLLVLVLLRASIQPGVHDHHRGSQSAASTNLNMYIFRDLYTSSGPRQKGETAVASAVVLKPMVHALHLPFGLKRMIPIKKNYFPVYNTCLLQFQICQCSVSSKMKFYRDENISSSVYS